METNINTDNHIAIGNTVPEGNVNLAYIHTPDAKPSKTISIASTAYNEGRQEYLANPNQDFCLDHDGISTYKTDSVEITDEFAFVRNASEQAMPLYYRAILNKSIDLRNVSSKIALYSTGFMKLPTETIDIEDAQGRTLVYFGSQIAVKKRFNKELNAQELFKVVLMPVTNGKEYEYMVVIYSNFIGKNDEYYTASYKPYGERRVQEEIINSEPFFKEMYSLNTGVTTLNPNFKIIEEDIYVSNTDQFLSLTPSFRISDGDKIVPLKVTEENGVMFLSTPIRIDGESVVLEHYPIESIREEYRMSGDENLGGVLDAKEYVTEYLSNIDRYRFIVPSKVDYLDNESRSGTLFKYQIDAKLETKYSIDNPKKIKIGIHYNNPTSENLGHLIPNMTNIMMGSSGFPDYILFENPNHEAEFTKEDAAYWIIDIFQPTEILTQYDIIIITGFGIFDMSVCGERLLTYLNNGGNLWFDNSGNGEEALRIIDWPSSSPTTFTFNNSVKASGYVYYVSEEYNNTYNKLYQGNGNRAGVEFVANNIPVSAALDIPGNEESHWTHHIAWSDSSHGLAHRHVGIGTIIASNMGIVRSTCSSLNGINERAGRLTFNILLDLVQKKWIKTPFIVERVHHIDNLFPIELGEAGYFLENYNSIQVAKKAIQASKVQNIARQEYSNLLHNIQEDPRLYTSVSVKEFMRYYIPQGFENAIGTYEVNAYNMDGTKSTNVFMTSPESGDDILWAFTTKLDNKNVNLEEKGYENIETSIDFEDVPFSCTITSYVYDLDQENNEFLYRELIGYSKSYDCTINKKKDRQTVVTLDQLPGIGGENEWNNKKNIFYRLRLGKLENGYFVDNEKNVNIGFYDTKTGAYLYNSDGDSILTWQELFGTRSNLFEPYNHDLQGRFLNEDQLPEGWYIAGKTNVIQAEVQGTSQRKYLYINLKSSGVKDDQEYDLSTNLFLNSGIWYVENKVTDYTQGSGIINEVYKISNSEQLSQILRSTDLELAKASALSFIEDENFMGYFFSGRTEREQRSMAKAIAELRDKYFVKQITDGYGIKKCNYNKKSLVLEKGKKYTISMDINLISGDPYMIALEDRRITKKRIVDMGAKAGTWKTVSFEFVSNGSYLQLYPIWCPNEDEAGVQCYVTNISVREKNTSLQDIVVHAWTNEYSIRASKRRFAIKEVDYKDIYVDYPSTNSLRDPWYLRVHKGKHSVDYYPNDDKNLTPKKCVYTIPEYSQQAFDPYFPYMKVRDEEKISFISSNIVKVQHKGILAGSLKLFRRTWDNRAIFREKLTTDDRYNFQSIHPNWVDKPLPRIEVLSEEFETIPHDNIIINYDEGKISFYGAVLGNVYATYNYMTTEEVEIRDIDSNNGIIYTNRHLDYKDDFYATYIYKEEFYEYKGYEDQELNLNPSYNPDIYSSASDTIMIYLLPYTVDGKVVNKQTLRHAFVKDFATVTSAEPMALKLAEIKLQRSDNEINATILDARRRGGGLKEKISKEMIARKHKDSIYFWDISPWDGIAYQSAGVVVIDIPKRVLNIMSEDDVKNVYLKKYLAEGVFAIVNFIDEEEVEYLGITSTSDFENANINSNITIEFNQEISKGPLPLSAITLVSNIEVPIGIDINGNNLVIIPAEVMETGTTYRLHIPRYSIVAKEDTKVSIQSDLNFVIKTIDI